PRERSGPGLLHPSPHQLARASSANGRAQRTGSRCVPVRHARPAVRDGSADSPEGGRMMKRQAVSKVELVPIDRITVINPRKRNRKVFEGIVRSISQLGLKRPITVIRKASLEGE